MKIELLYFDDCPNWKVAAERLADVAAARGLTVERRLVTTPEEAEAARFRGSPTILVDGAVPFAAATSRSGWLAACTRPPTAWPGRPRPSSSRRFSMRDRALAPAALVGAIACCGAMALVAGLVGGVALAAIGRFTVISVAALGVVVVLAWRLDRHRHRYDRTIDTRDRSEHLTGTPR